MSLGAILLYLLYPDYDARFLLWKGVQSIAFLVAVLAYLSPRGRGRITSAIRVRGPFSRQPLARSFRSRPLPFGER